MNTIFLSQNIFVLFLRKTPKISVWHLQMLQTCLFIFWHSKHPSALANAELGNLMGERSENWSFRFFSSTYSVLEPRNKKKRLFMMNIACFFARCLLLYFLVYLKLYINGSQFHIMYLLAPYLSHNVGKYLLKWWMDLIKYVFLPAAIKSIHKMVEGRFAICDMDGQSARFLLREFKVIWRQNVRYLL